jgi:CheY-like chemotaxis protein
MATVLVVDGEFGIVEVITVALEDEGHHVVVAVNGRQAWQRRLWISDCSTS